jgi:hypothetical protein
MTFGEIRAHILQAMGANDPDTKSRSTTERSIRRSLHRLVSDGMLLALGHGGRGDPHRYFLNPMMVAIAGDEQSFDNVSAAIEADPDGNRAANAAAGRLFKGE